MRILRELLITAVIIFSHASSLANFHRLLPKKKAAAKIKKKKTFQVVGENHKATAEGSKNCLKNLSFSLIT